MTITMVLAGLLIFTIIVVVHELGHYWAARKAGIHVEEFSIGMGPRLLSRVGKNGTRWSIKAFPIGGSCMMLGEDEEAADPRSFGSKPLRWRILVIAGGSAMNFALALIIATAMAMFTSYREATVRDFTDISPAAAAGMEIGDRVVRVNNQNVNIWGDFSLEMQRVQGEPIDLVVERDGALLNFTLYPHFLEEENRFIVGFIPGWAVGPFFGATLPTVEGPPIYVDQEFWVHRESIVGALQNGFHNMIFSVRAVIFGLVGLITGVFGVDGLMGPLGIVTFAGGQVEGNLAAGGIMAGFWSVMSFTYLLSANLAIINLLPLPALDGGRLVFLLLEAVRRKPIHPDKEGMVHFAGFVLLMAFLIFITYNDIARLFTG